MHRLQPSPAGYRLLEMVTTSSAVRSGDHARIAACCAAAYVALCAVSRGRPPSAERQAFREVNRRQDRTWLRVPQQLGTPWALPSAAGALLLAGRRRAAAAALAALPVEKGLEVLTKKVARRPRPVKLDAPELRDDAPTEGPAMPSGHAAIAAAALYFAAAETGSLRAAAVVGTAVASVTGLVRVHQGAHWPVDTVAGVVLGVGTAAGLSAAAGSLGPRIRAA